MPLTFSCLALFVSSKFVNVVGFALHVLLWIIVLFACICMLHVFSADHNGNERAVVPVMDLLPPHSHTVTVIPPNLSKIHTFPYSLHSLKKASTETDMRQLHRSRAVIRRVSRAASRDQPSQHPQSLPSSFSSTNFTTGGQGIPLRVSL